LNRDGKNVKKLAEVLIKEELMMLNNETAPERAPETPLKLGEITVSMEQLCNSLVGYFVEEELSGDAAVTRASLARYLGKLEKSGDRLILPESSKPEEVVERVPRFEPESSTSVSVYPELSSNTIVPLRGQNITVGELVELLTTSPLEGKQDSRLALMRDLKHMKPIDGEAGTQSFSLQTPALDKVLFGKPMRSENGD